MTQGTVAVKTVSRLCSSCGAMALPKLKNSRQPTQLPVRDSSGARRCHGSGDGGGDDDDDDDKDDDDDDDDDDDAHRLAASRGAVTATTSNGTSFARRNVDPEKYSEQFWGRALANASRVTKAGAKKDPAAAGRNLQ